MSDRTAPFFIAGVDRSGLGLLAELLDGHPQIAVSRRTHFWPRYHDRFGDLGDRSNLARCIDAMLQQPHIAELDVDRAELLAEVAGADPSYGDLFAALQELRLRRVGKSRWGDKSHGCEADAGAIFTDFPDARMIHMVRDPRDRYASQAAHRNAPRGGAASGAALWLWSARLAERNVRTFGERYLIVQYEHLVEAPLEALSGVCRHVGVSYDGVLLADRHLHPESIGRFVRDLAPRERVLIERFSGRRMAHFGYEPHGRTGGRAAQALDLPLGALRIAGWHASRRFREVR